MVSYKIKQIHIFNYLYRIYQYFRRWISGVLYYAALIGIFVAIFISQFVKLRTQSFVSTNVNSGVCDITDWDQFNDQLFLTSTDVCCPVPLSVTGTFLIDYDGHWNTEPGFNANHNIYGVTLLGLNYTNKQWKEVMQSISGNVTKLTDRAKKRDFSWNFLSWSMLPCIQKIRQRVGTGAMKSSILSMPIQ
jgi:hypothetical protein